MYRRNIGLAMAPSIQVVPRVNYLSGSLRILSKGLFPKVPDNGAEPQGQHSSPNLCLGGCAQLCRSEGINVNASYLNLREERDMYCQLATVEP